MRVSWIENVLFSEFHLWKENIKTIKSSILKCWFDKKNFRHIRRISVSHKQTWGKYRFLTHEASMNESVSAAWGKRPSCAMEQAYYLYCICLRWLNFVLKLMLELSKTITSASIHSSSCYTPKICQTTIFLRKCMAKVFNKAVHVWWSRFSFLCLCVYSK